MKKKLLLLALLALGIFGAKANDPVIMTINGKDVKLSEFEYMYNKNNKQQIEKESLNDYVDRFVVYKLKVADAEAAGLDTISTFVNELNGHKTELAKPYLDDSKYAEPFLREGYERMKKNLHVSHIMLPLMPDSKVKLDSIRNCIVFGENFEELAKRYSVDQYSSQSGGDLGMLWVGKYPYSFEDAAYKTPIGQVSPVVETQFGFHLIKVNGENTQVGKYRVAHIVKTYNNPNDPESVKVIDAQMDSVYNLLKNGADFAQVAKDFSDDKRSAANGGELGWYKKGQLVKPIEVKMITTPIGEVSEPSKADYGVHLVKVLEYKPLGSYEDNKEELMTIIERDERTDLMQQNKLNDLKIEFKVVENENFFKDIEDLLPVSGLDSTFINKVQKSDIIAFSYVGGDVKASEIIKSVNSKIAVSKEQGLQYVKNLYNSVLKDALLNYEKANLATKYLDYANLLNEYRDGLLLFEISNKMVWQKSSDDKEGLDNFFKKNKSKYTNWTSPKFKGLIIYAKNDSIEKEVKSCIATLGGDTIANTLYKKFRKNIRIERHLTAMGENQFVDELVFDGPKANNDGKYQKYFVLEGKIINQPEEASDARAQVTTDYQNELEKNWIKELKSKFKVKVNKKVLKLVKEQ